MEKTIRTSQALGLTSSLVLAGINLGSSFLTVPLLYKQPTSVSTTIFREFYINGAITLVPLGIFSGACSALAAYLVPSERTLWAIASTFTLAQLPWTLIVMMSTNNRLCGIAVSPVEQEKVAAKEVVNLLQRWAWMNIVRGGLALVGGVTGVWALLQAQVKESRI